MPMPLEQRLGSGEHLAAEQDLQDVVAPPMGDGALLRVIDGVVMAPPEFRVNMYVIRA